jgi:endoglucanase
MRSNPAKRIASLSECGAGLCLLLFLFSAQSVSAAKAYVRVNQVGYEVGTESRAYLMTESAPSAPNFKVVNSDGAVVFVAMVGASLGKWGSFTVFPLDFQIKTPGLYTITVEAPSAGSSPSFRIDSAEKLYSQGLANALHFYRNERDGPNFIETPLRTAPGHLNDARASAYESPQFDNNDGMVGELNPTGAVIDASGGWWDAGDYLKFVQTHSYAIALMLIGIRDFPQQMGPAAGAPDFKSEAKFGVDWLQKMWNDDTKTLYYQVGIGTDFDDSPNILSDHDLWRLPQADDTLGGTDPAYQFVRHRPAFVAAPAGAKISPNLAGRLAADFATCFQVFQYTYPDLAHRCLLSAEHVFDLADTSPTGQLVTTAPFDFYGETEWRDDLELGAAELYFALERLAARQGLPHNDPLFYLKASAHWAHAYITGPNDASDTLNLYDVSGLAHFELFRAIGVAGHPAGLEVSQSDLVQDLRKQLNNAVAQAATDPFGFGYPWDVYDTATHGAGLSVMASEYSLLTQSKTFEDFSRRWAANILGANAWGSSFIVGDGETFPDCMQHQVANIVGSLDGTPPILAGALVEGPNSFAATGLLDGMRKCPPAGGDVFKKFDAGGAVFKDDQQSFSTVEPAIDLTAPSFLMFSWRIARLPATLLPASDISPALDPNLVSAPDSSWPVRRTPARHRSNTAN